jgi:hypothetical protein
MSSQNNSGSRKNRRSHTWRVPVAQKGGNYFYLHQKKYIPIRDENVLYYLRNMKGTVSHIEIRSASARPGQFNITKFIVQDDDRERAVDAKETLNIIEETKNRDDRPETSPENDPFLNLAHNKTNQTMPANGQDNETFPEPQETGIPLDESPQAREERLLGYFRQILSERQAQNRAEMNRTHQKHHYGILLKTGVDEQNQTYFVVAFPQADGYRQTSLKLPSKIASELLAAHIHAHSCIVRVEENTDITANLEPCSLEIASDNHDFAPLQSLLNTLRRNAVTDAQKEFNPGSRQAAR